MHNVICYTFQFIKIYFMLYFCIFGDRMDKNQKKECEDKLQELLSLYFTFFKIGSVTFGGGYAMLPLLQQEFVAKRQWTTDEELMDYFAIGQCTPGIIAVNVSTFIGNKRKGITGGIVSTLGFVTFPIILLIIIAAFLQNFADYPIVKNAFAGIRVAVCVLILQAIERLWKKSVINHAALSLFAIIFTLMVFTSVSPVVLVISSGAFGILWNLLKGGNQI